VSANPAVSAPLTLTEIDRPVLGCVEGPDRRCGGIVAVRCGAGMSPRSRPWFARITYRRTDAAAPWEVASYGCVEAGDADWVSMREISYRLDYEVLQPLGRPTITVESSTATVGVPVAVSTTYPQRLRPPGELLSVEPVRAVVPLRIDRPRGGLDLELTLRAAYTWTFQDGGTARGRGSPVAGEPAPGGGAQDQVTAVFTTAGPKNVHLHVRWSGTARLGTLPPVPLDPVDIDTDAMIEVVGPGSGPVTAR
jgi:hypothetical protein